MSNKTVEQLVKDAKMNPLGLDDEFYFGCNGCGKCCSHMDILLSAYDVYCLARHLNMKTEEIVRDYCVVTAGCESGLPIVYIRLKDGRCPFLDGQRCGVQKAKPFVCAAYPLGRLYSQDEDKVFYFQQKRDWDCGSVRQRHTVRKWIYENRDMAEDGTAFKMWTNMLNMIIPIAPDISGRAQTMFVDVLVSYLYIGYDLNKPFLLQFEERSKKVGKLAKELIEIRDSAKEERKKL